MSDEYVPSLPNAKDQQCKPDESQEDCEKRAWKTSLQTICGAAATAASAGSSAQAAFKLCGTLAGPLANLTYKPLKIIANFVGTAMQNAIMAVIPEGWKAHGIFDPWYAAYTMWPPFQGAWDTAVSTVQQAWDEARMQAGLDPAPIQIDTQVIQALIYRQNARIKLPDSEAAKHIEAGNHMSGPALQPSSHLNGSLSDSLEALADIPRYVDAAGAIKYWCDRDQTPNSGWAESAVIFSSRDGVNINVASRYPYCGGDVSNTVTYDAAGKGDSALCGPFGLAFYRNGSWAGCSEGCKDAIGIMIQQIWAMRLASVQRALPWIILAIAAQTAQESRPDLFNAARLADAERFEKQEAGVGIGTVLVIGSALAGAGWLTWKYWLKDYLAAMKAKG